MTAVASRLGSPHGRGAGTRLSGGPGGDCGVGDHGVEPRAAGDACIELCVEVTPTSPFRLPRMLGMDGLTRRRAGVIERLLHDPGGEPVVVRVAQTAPDAVLFGARAHARDVAEHGIARMRFALGVDDDLSEFYASYRNDPLIGRSLRARPWLRVGRRPEPFEALVWAVCEQLIEYERAAAIQRNIVARLGRRWSDAGVSVDARVGAGVGKGRSAGHGHGGSEWARELRDLPTPVRLGGAALAVLQACDLAAGRAIALRRAAREVASGRVDLYDRERPECGWQRLRAIPGIGAWTVETMALRGQGRYDQLPAGDLSLLKLAGRVLSGGDPWARAGEDQVRELFAPYGAWAGLAAVHAAGL